MKTSAIICEFNPLHTGHKKLIDFSKTVSDKVICIMSGNFTERGMPSCCNKYKRAAHAVKAGADMVVELPTVYAAAAAPDFAMGGVKIAEELNVDYLIFGSECGNMEQLQGISELLNDAEVNAKIKTSMSKGITYPKAVASVCGNGILDKPNNTLAIEYINAISKSSSRITPLTLVREDNFNGKPQRFASSTILRNEPSYRNEFSFDYVIRDIDDTIEEKYLEYATRFLATADKNYLENIADVTEGLHNRIFNADKTCGFEKMMEEIKTKRYTRARLQRIVLNCVLGITKEIHTQYKMQTPKIKVLAIKKGEEQLLCGIENESDALTQKADRLYATFDGETPPCKLLKI
ncbi:MAG: nucleotidyltransferase family protein [Corallococcus sp.]|nr:nucleotidyltransferase family protein [Corallococcus sp.]MCM1359458.1 nucleotidyltransferase family protein [Corallococcus sp.]MCM1394730.1 nucleotidyltransferase family protein [Corallococcus sp.]